VIEGLHQIVIPTPFKLGPVNCYVTTMDPITLIDTGTKGDESRAAWTGHGHPIHDVHKVVRQRLRFHERPAQRILNLIGTEERSVYQIAEPLFGRSPSAPPPRCGGQGVSGTEAFLALSETIGHLDWLEEQGRIKMVKRDDVIHWRQK
jgi:hypothetical protein